MILIFGPGGADGPPELVGFGQETKNATVPDSSVTKTRTFLTSAFPLGRRVRLSSDSVLFDDNQRYLGHVSEANSLAQGLTLERSCMPPPKGERYLQPWTRMS